MDSGITDIYQDLVETSNKKVQYKYRNLES